MVSGTKPKRRGGKKSKAAKKVHWVDETTEPDTVESLHRLINTMQAEKDGAEIDIRLYQGQMTTMEKQVTALRREKTWLKRRITALEVSEALTRKRAEEAEGKWKMEKRRGDVLCSWSREWRRETCKWAQRMMDLVGWEEDDWRMLP
jgi:chromosome segregation ATPase